MAATGNLQSNVTIDIDALNNLIIMANKYRQEVDAAADEIRLICQQMEDNESLKGGDGDLIRENFKTISLACRGIYESTTFVSKVLNDKLKDSINKTKGETVGNSTENIQRSAKKAGVLKK